nr:unnamed protein product [Spirometra erinaceieuropaei]
MALKVRHRRFLAHVALTNKNNSEALTYALHHITVPTIAQSNPHFEIGQSGPEGHECVRAGSKCAGTIRGSANGTRDHSSLLFRLSLAMALADVEVFKDAFPLVRSCPALNEIRTSGELKELVIEVKHGAILNAHRIIQAARIPSLRAALSGAPGKDNSVLKWPTVPLNLANSLLQYVYTGQLEVTQANAMAIVMFAKMMRLSNLENWGVQFMTNRVNLENLATTWDFAKSMRMGSLMETCINLMQAQFTNVVSTDLFIRLPADTVLTLLRNDNLSVDSEEAVFEAISSWVAAAGDKECDNERLRLHAPEMLKEVRWCQTTEHFRGRLLNGHPIFQNSPECALLLGGVVHWIAAADKPPCPFNRRRRPPQTIFFVFGKDKNQDRWSVLRFDQQLEKEERIADMEKRELASYSVVGESIFVVGGDSAQGSFSTSVEEFLVAERRWRKRASLAVGRRWHAAAVLTEAGGEALLGVFGGWGNGACLSSCEVYEFSRDRWFKLPDLREKRSSTAAACLPGDSRIFVFGGWNGSITGLASVQFCHLRADWRERATSSDFWQPAAPMRIAPNGVAATHFRGKIIVAGGNSAVNRLNVVQMFTPPDARCPQGQWTQLAGMKEARAYFALLTSNDDAIFALGPSNTVETFTAPGGPADVSNDLTAWSWSSKKPLETLGDIEGAASIRMWFKLPDLREKRGATAAACLPGDSRVFVFGGYNGPSSCLASVEFCHLRADWRERATSSDFWQPAAPMRTARDGLAATHFRGKIIVGGGFGVGGKSLNVVEMFTPPDARCPQGQWTDLAGMKEPRNYFALLTSTDDVIFALANDASSFFALH